jgi:hypothetical protein
VAYGGRREIQAAGCSRHMALFKHSVEEHQQIEIDFR